MHVMTVARELDLPEWLIFSGAIYQPVLNHLTGREADYGIKDYDLGYFDPSDTSYEAEDEVIQRVAQTFAPPFSEMVEVRNQARVHLWFEDKFREPYAPLASSEEALSRFTTTAFSVGVRLEADDGLTILAPFGLEDLFALRLRPNPNRRTTGFGRTAESAMRRWPELRVIAG
ncbi:nucleotidyltransferase family protein [Phenylobacterium sp.]|uniref:nucleotidyltransferase family protein n=1 Tax=Phenylobacterium sp. TaxID=1871053 RepID=UPI00351D9900